jgi:phosphomannomutase/phosphoglucomutase
MSIPTNIFRGYDIRGLTGSELTPELLETLGKAYATFLYRRQIRECVVGMDIRETSPVYKEAFIKGLTSEGIDVIDFGLTLTQIMYFAQYHYLSKGGAMITASHNPREFNGLKLAVGFSDTLVGSEIQEIRQIAESGSFAGW